MSTRLLLLPLALLALFVLNFTMSVAESGAASLPRVLQLRAVEQADGIRLSWQPQAGADGYRVYCACGFGAARQVASVDLPAGAAGYTFPGYTAAQGCGFRVAALQGGVEGQVSFPAKALGKGVGLRSDVAQ